MKESRPVNPCRRAAHAPVLVLVAIATGVLTSARADVVDIAWDANGRFERSLNVASAKFAEVCGKLSAGQKVRWDFKSSTSLDFNVHYHVGKEVVFPSKLTAVAAAKDVLDTKVDQDYCWMWINKSTSPATVKVTLHR